MRLRLIAGSLGGRLLTSPDTAVTHPMGERMRGALFNILGDISGMTVLDPFAGSGAIGLEAVSRGAKHAVMIERDKRAQETIKKNVETLNVVDKTTVVKANCLTWSDHHLEELFDIIIVDPPYQDLQLSTVSRLTRHLNHNGLMVLSYPGRGSAPTVNGVVVVNNRYYGDAALAFYRKTA